MAYRRTARVMQRLAARGDAIIAAARALASDQGMQAVQIVPVAARAGIAAGTVYRYFPAKTDLIAALISAVLEHEITAMQRAADAAPGPLSALAAVLATFAARAQRDRRLAWAVIAEPVEPQVDAVRAALRKEIAAEFEQRIRAAVAGGHVPEQDAGLASTAIFGALLGGLIGPLAPHIAGDSVVRRETAQALTLFSLRALGVADAHARGLVMQIDLARPEQGG